MKDESIAIQDQYITIRHDIPGLAREGDSLIIIAGRGTLIRHIKGQDVLPYLATTAQAAEEATHAS